MNGNATAAADAGPAGGSLLRTAQESFVVGWQQAMWAGVAVMAALFIHVVARGPQRPPATPPTTAAV